MTPVMLDGPLEAQAPVPKRRGWIAAIGRRTAAIVALAGLVLAGCGGGGESSESLPAANPPVVTAPVITTQPQSQAVDVGASVTFTVAASGNGLSYAWQRSTTGGLAWQGITGATTASFTLGAVDASMNGYQFRVVVQNPAGIVASAAAVLSVRTTGIGTVQDVAAGWVHSLVRTADGGVWSWGSNDKGQLGYGQTSEYSIQPKRVLRDDGTPLAGVVQVSAGLAHSLAVTGDGSLYAWGDNSFGKLGDGSTDQRTRAVLVRDAAGQPFAGVRAAAAGDNMSVAVKSDGTVWVWGWQVSVLPPTRQPTPIRDRADAPLTGAVRVALNGSTVLIVKADGSVWSWGAGLLSNSAVELSDRAVPVEIAAGVPLADVIQASVGWSHALATTRDGRVYSWGTGWLGRTASLAAGRLAGLVTTSNGTAVTGVTRAHAGDFFSVLHMGDGTAQAFGSNDQRLLGADSANAFEDWPVPVRTATGRLGDVASASLTHKHTLVLRGDGTVWGWGINLQAQLARTPDLFDRQFAVAARVLP